MNNFKISKKGKDFNVGLKKISNKQKEQKEFTEIRYDYTSKLNITFFEVIKTPKNIKRIPGKNETAIYNTTNNISSSEIIDKINLKFRIIEITTTFVVIDKKNIELLEKYNFNKIATRLYYGKYEKYNELIRKLNYNEKLIVNSHVKNFLLKCENEIYLTISTSANPKLSDQFENYIVENSKENYDNLLRYYSFENTKINLQIPKKNEKYGFFDVRNFTGLNMLNIIAKKEKITDLHLFIYSTGKKNIAEVKKIIEKYKIKNITFFLSGFIKRMLTYTLPVYFSISNNIKFFNHHSKIILIKTNKNYYFINSSENLNSNSKIEHTEIFNNKDYYNFVLSFGNKYFK